VTQPIIVFDSKDKKIRLAIIVAVIVGLVFAWFSIRWQLGNMLAELTPLNQPNASEIADAAVHLAPGDPMPRWLAASKEKENFSPEGIERSVKMFEEVVRLSPNDFRWWIELGRAYEQAEKPAEAEMAFKRAVDLAPAYTFPHWQFGNFYLRQNRSEDAFTELRKTTEKSAVYREQVFSLAWDYFDKDPQKVEQLAMDTPDVRASLALFYAVRGSSENSLRIWNTLTDEQKAPHLKTAKNMAQGLFDKRQFQQSLEFARQTGIDPESQAETITNGGFEKFIGAPEETLFGWQVYRSNGKIDIMPDSAVKTEGTRSLRVSFKTYTKSELHNIVQFVAVQPNARYRLTFSLRTENLRSGSTPFLQVVNGKDNQGVAASQPFPIGSADWQQITVDFTVPEGSDGISLRTTRLPCEECPLIGAIWYDDFKISRL
jgi:hypothetical protein